MLDQSTVAFGMPRGLPAASVSFLDSDTFVSVDGISCDINVYAQDGKHLQSVRTARAYKTVRFTRDTSADRIGFALGNCQGTPLRVYVLNSRFEEIGSFDLQAAHSDTCPDTECLQDIVYAEGILYTAFRHGVYAYGTVGLPQSTVLSTDHTRSIQKYTVSGTARAFAFCRSQTQFVRVTEIGADYLGTPTDALVLRDLVPYGLGDVYGLFGYRYLYNYIIPIYKNGAFCLPTDGDLVTILQNTRYCE